MRGGWCALCMLLIAPFVADARMAECCAPWHSGRS